MEYQTPRNREFYDSQSATQSIIFNQFSHLITKSLSYIQKSNPTPGFMINFANIVKYTPKQLILSQGRLEGGASAPPELERASPLPYHKQAVPHLFPMVYLGIGPAPKSGSLGVFSRAKLPDIIIQLKSITHIIVQETSLSQLGMQCI